MGDYLVGVRANDLRVDAALRQALAAHLVRDIAAPHANYAIRIEPQAPGATPQQLHALYEGGCLIVRSRRPEEVIAALVRELSVQALTRRGATIVRCTLIVREDGDAILLSAALRRQLALNSSRLGSQGMEVVATPAVLIEDGTGYVVVPPKAITLAADCFAALIDGDRDRLDQELAERRLRVRAWVLLSAPGELVPISRAAAVALSRAALLEDVPVTPTVLHGLAQVLRISTPVGAGDLHTWEVVDRVSEVP